MKRRPKPSKISKNASKQRQNKAKAVKKDNKGSKTYKEEKRSFCPLCGSTAIRKLKDAYRCINCGAKFSKPKTTTLRLRKKPRYIG